jgi:hypothetical protein
MKIAGNSRLIIGDTCVQVDTGNEPLDDFPKQDQSRDKHGLGAAIPRRTVLIPTVHKHMLTKTSV